MLDRLISFTQLGTASTLEQIGYLFVFLLVTIRDGLFHSWHWSVKKGDINPKAHSFIKAYGEPHLSIYIQSLLLYLWMYLAGVHVAGIAGAVLFAWAVFDGLIDMGAGHSFWINHHDKVPRWSLIIKGKTIITVPTNPLPKWVRISGGLIFIVISLLWL